jgi:hypothetical protein
MPWLDSAQQRLSFEPLGPGNLGGRHLPLAVEDAYVIEGGEWRV